MQPVIRGIEFANQHTRNGLSDAMERRLSTAEEHLDLTAARLKEIFSASLTNHDAVTLRPNGIFANAEITSTPSIVDPLASSSSPVAASVPVGVPEPSALRFSISPPSSPVSPPLNDATRIYSSYSSPVTLGAVANDNYLHCNTCANIYCKANGHCLRKSSGRP